MSRRDTEPAGARPPLSALRAALAGESGLDVGPSVLADELLTHALTHRSWAYEHGGVPTNERLEFLGDAVLGMVVTEALFRGHPDLAEGALAKLRASVVNMRALAGVAADMDLGAHLLLGRGEETTGGRAKASILADALEAVLGAVHLAAGLALADPLVRALFDPLIAAAASDGAGLDWKTSLQELAASSGAGVPAYVVAEDGPDHAKHFTAQVLLRGQPVGGGEGGSKKEAEQRAAQAACAVLRGAGVGTRGWESHT